MKAVILVTTLKSGSGHVSNTAVLAEFVASKLENHGVTTDIIKIADHKILPGTYIEMDESDDWPDIFTKIESSDIFILATPVWWGSHSSLAQRVIERLDEVHDEIMAGNESRLKNKVGGIIITGGSDGVQQIIGNISNFFSFIGITIPPYASVSITNEKLAKGKNSTKDELVDFYQSKLGSSADTMIKQLVKYAKLLKSS